MLSILSKCPHSETSWREFSVRNIYRAGKNLENIVSGERVTQTFTASSAFDCILVQGYLKNGEVSDGGCQVEIQDETGKTLVSTFLTAQQIEDMVGWIKVEDTNINYPVVQSVNEPNFYLKHKFDKTYSAR